MQHLHREVLPSHTHRRTKNVSYYGIIIMYAVDKKPNKSNR